jgi:hypothetical protein
MPVTERGAGLGGWAAAVTANNRNNQDSHYGQMVKYIAIAYYYE